MPRGFLTTIGTLAMSVPATQDVVAQPLPPVSDGLARAGLRVSSVTIDPLARSITWGDTVITTPRFFPDARAGVADVVACLVSMDNKLTPRQPPFGAGQ